jgi:hypothetical protein
LSWSVPVWWSGTYVWRHIPGSRCVSQQNWPNAAIHFCLCLGGKQFNIDEPDMFVFWLSLLQFVSVLCSQPLVSSSAIYTHEVITIHEAMFGQQFFCPARWIGLLAGQHVFHGAHFMVVGRRPVAKSAQSKPQDSPCCSALLQLFLGPGASQWCQRMTEARTCIMENCR